MITDTTYRALCILRDNPGIRPREFSKKMWPDSLGHQNHTPAGPHGVTRGGGMWLAAGGYLGKLAHRGLTRGYENHYLAAEGKAAIEEYEASHAA